MRLLWSITAYKKPFRVTWRGLVIAGQFFPIKFRLNLQQPLKWNQIRRNYESRTRSKKSDNILKKQTMFKKWLEASKTLDLNEIAFGKKQMSTSLFFETKNGNEVDHHYHPEDDFFMWAHTHSLSLTHTHKHTHTLDEWEFEGDEKRERDKMRHFPLLRRAQKMSNGQNKDVKSLFLVQLLFCAWIKLRSSLIVTLIRDRAAREDLVFNRVE